MRDSGGNLYGTTSGGGDTNCNPRNLEYGCGTVFELSPGKGGTWTETVLYTFPGGHGNAFPLYGALVLDSAGNLYGTTAGTSTGNEGRGTVFELVRGAQGVWKHRVLYQFPGKDGLEYPAAGVVFDKAGNLYATAPSGGTEGECYSGCGTLVELSPSQGGWTENVLHDFGASGDGYNPFAGLARYRDTIAGTTVWGGPNAYGTVYEFVP